MSAPLIVRPPAALFPEINPCQAGLPQLEAAPPARTVASATAAEAVEAVEAAGAAERPAN